MSLTDKEWKALKAAHPGIEQRSGKATDKESLTVQKPATEGRPAGSRLALGRLSVGDMNRTEEAYCAHLGIRQYQGEILWYKFEGLKFRLADKTFYTPDFAVMLADGQIELHEVKGGPWMDDARVKIKVAASMYPFRFVGVKKTKGGWEYENFSDTSTLTEGERT